MQNFITTPGHLDKMEAKMKHRILLIFCLTATSVKIFTVYIIIRSQLPFWRDVLQRLLGTEIARTFQNTCGLLQSNANDLNDVVNYKQEEEEEEKQY